MVEKTLFIIMNINLIPSFQPSQTQWLRNSKTAKHCRATHLYPQNNGALCAVSDSKPYN